MEVLLSHQNKVVSGTLGKPFWYFNKEFEQSFTYFMLRFWMVLHCHFMQSHLRIMAACFNWKEHIIRETVIHVDHYYTCLQKKGRCDKIRCINDLSKVYDTAKQNQYLYKYIVTFENVIVESYKIKPATFSFIKWLQNLFFTPSKRVQKKPRKWPR